MWTAELESRVRWHFDFVHQIENHHSEIIYRRFLKFKWWGGVSGCQQGGFARLIMHGDMQL